MATIQRTQIIGTMRAIGAQSSLILQMVVIEAVMLGVVFGGLGIALSTVFMLVWHSVGTLMLAQQHLSGDAKIEELRVQGVGEWMEDFLQPDSAQDLAILDDGHAAFEQAGEARCAQKRCAPAIDHVFVDLTLAPSERCGARLAWGNVGRDRRCAVQTLKPQQVTAVVHDGDRYRPVVAGGLGARTREDRVDVRHRQHRLALHPSAPWSIGRSSLRK